MTPGELYNEQNLYFAELLGSQERLTKERDEARAEVDRLREALAFYANDRTWIRNMGGGVGPWSLADDDDGARARAALEPAK